MLDMDNKLRLIKITLPNIKCNPLICLTCGIIVKRLNSLNKTLFQMKHISKRHNSQKISYIEVYILIK